MAKKFVDGHGLVDDRKPVCRHGDCPSVGTENLDQANDTLIDPANVTGGYGSAPNKGRD